MKSSLKKIISFFLALAMVIGMIPEVLPEAEAASTNIHDIIFSWEYYYNKYPDLQRAFGKNPSALRNHWEQYGKREGRVPSELYDPSFYRNKYNDLRRAFGNDNVALYNHAVSCGISELRQLSGTFNASVYKQNYADLRAAYGNDNKMYYYHWVNHGKSERRNCTSLIKQQSNSGSTTPAMLESGWYKIEIPKTTYAINLQYAPKSGNANAVLDPFNSEGNEMFYIENVGGYRYYIRPHYRYSEGDFALNSLYGASGKNNQQLIAHDSTNKGDTASLWYIEKHGDNYSLRNVASNRYVTLSGSAKTGAKLVLQSKFSGSNQVFSFRGIKVSPPPSQKKSTFWPVKGGRPVKKEDYPKYIKDGTVHTGTDIAGTMGTPIIATHSGTVTYARDKGNYGNLVIITTEIEGKKVEFYYAHMSKIGVTKGATVLAGQEIGKVGSTGNSTGPHLHYEVRESGRHVDPYNYLPV